MAENTMTKEQVINRLKAGNKRYVNDDLNRNKQDSARRMELIDHQEPYAVVLACGDSRVIPEMIFDTGIGELFVIRVAGNVANTSSLASIEYAIANLNTEIVVTLGHEGCGAVTAAVKGGDLGHNINHLLMHINPALHAVKGDDVNTVVKKNAELTSIEMVRRSQIIEDAVEKGNVQLLPAYYNLSSGIVEFL